MGIDVYINDAVPKEGESAEVGVPHDETCIFWRALRKVLKDGNPAFENVLVCVRGRDGGSYPLLMLTTTKARQVVCWLALPPRVPSSADNARVHFIDHVTLDLKNRRSHSSAYREQGGKLPTAHEWKLCEFPKNGVLFWFGFSVSRNVIEKQVLHRDGWMKPPKGDEERRKQEYARFWEHMRIIDAYLPGDAVNSGDSLCGFVYLVNGPKVTLSPDMLPAMSESAGEFVEGIDEPRFFPVNSTGLVVGSVQLGMLLGYLPWRLKDDGPFLLAPGLK